MRLQWKTFGLGVRLLEAISDPGQRVSIFNYSDPIVHNRVFGLARFDLNTRKFDFTPIGPAPVAMTGLHITPDKEVWIYSEYERHGRQSAL